MISDLTIDQVPTFRYRYLGCHHIQGTELVNARYVARKNESLASYVLIIQESGGLMRK